MSSLSNILAFIEKTGSSKSALEKKCGLPNATLKNKQALNADLTPEIVDKISNCMRGELEANGFYIIDVSPFDKPIWVIVNEDERARIVRRDIVNAKEEARPIGRAEESDGISVEASLASLLEGQNEIRAQLQTIHRWDAEVYAAGDDAKEAEAVAHIGMLYAESLQAMKKKGIHPLVDRRDKVIP